MEETKYCQSCGMQLDSDEVIATNSDSSKNDDYCIYCYENGKFTSDSTMDEMIEISVKHMNESGAIKEHFGTEQKARDYMYSFFPKLKRWIQS